jgi:hypothetical protein
MTVDVRRNETGFASLALTGQQVGQPLPSMVSATLDIRGELEAIRKVRLM